MTTAGTYPAQQGVDAHGVLLLLSNTVLRLTIDGSIVDWLPIGNVVDLSSPRMSKSFHDVTPSIPGAWKQSIPGYKDPGSVTFTLLFNSELRSHSILLKSFNEDTKERFRIAIPSSDATEYDYKLSENNPDWAHWEFDGYVAAISTSHQAGGIIGGSVSVRLTGRVEAPILENDMTSRG